MLITTKPKDLALNFVPILGKFSFLELDLILLLPFVLKAQLL